MTAPWLREPAPSGYPTIISQEDEARARIAGAATFFRNARDHRPSPREREVRAHLVHAARLIGRQPAA